MSDKQEMMRFNGVHRPLIYIVPSKFSGFAGMAHSDNHYIYADGNEFLVKDSYGTIVAELRKHGFQP
jgi:hypothetical protein